MTIPSTRVRGVLLILLAAAITSCAAPTAPNAARTTLTTSAPATSPAAASELVLYLQQEYGPQLQPLEPTTLADATNRSPFVLEDVDRYQQSELFITPNGGTVVALVDDQVRVLDGQSGALQAEWSRPQGIIRGISPDGTRLTGWGLTEDIRAWAVLSVADGKVVTSGSGTQTLYDWNAQRAYSLADPGSGDPMAVVEPQPAVLLVHDLQSGNEVGRLTLDGVLHGNFTTGSFGPSMALHPNGQQLVVMHGDADKLTVVNTEQLQIVSTRDLTGSQDPLEAGGTVRGWDLQFAPDGTLYAGGNEQPTVRYLGVRRINVEQATVEAEALIDENWSWYRVAPDGSAVFFYGSRSGPLPSATQGGPPPNPAVLRRLDPQTLAITAERSFEGFYQPFLVTEPEQ